MLTTYPSHTGSGSLGKTGNSKVVVTVHLARQQAAEARQRRDWEAERRWRQQELAIPVRIGFLRRVIRLWS